MKRLRWLDRSRARDFFNASGCISDFGFFTYLSNSRTEDEARTIERHLAGCGACTETLAIMSQCDYEETKETTHPLLESVPIERYQEFVTSYLSKTAPKKHAFTGPARGIRILASPTFAYSLVAVLGIGLLLAVLRIRLPGERPERLYTQAMEHLKSISSLETASGLRLIASPAKLEIHSKEPEGSDLNALDKALFYLGQSLVLNPRDIRPRLALGEIYLVKRQSLEARKQFEEAIKLDKNNQAALNGFGITCFEEGMAEMDPYARSELLSTAAASFAKILQRHPKPLEAVYNQAITYYQLGDKAKTLELIEAYLARDPKSNWAKNLIYIRDKLRLSSYKFFKQEVEQAFKKGESDRIETMVSLSSYTPWLIESAMRASLRLTMKGNLESAKDSLQLNEALGKAYSDFTGDESYRRLIDLYHRFTAEQTRQAHLADRMVEDALRYYEQGRLDESLQISAKAVRICRTLRDYWHEAYIHHLMGNCYFFRLADYERALTAYEAMALAAQKAGNLEALTRALDNIAVCYQYRGKYDDMKTVLGQMIPLAKKIKNPLQEAFGLTHLGNLYRELGQWKESMHCHSQALILSAQMGDENGQLDGLQRIALLYQSNKEYDKSNVFFDIALRVLDKIQLDPEARVGKSWIDRTRYYLLSYEADNHLATEHLTKAKELLKRAHEIAARVENREVRTSDLMRRALLSARFGEFKKAHEQLDAALVLARQAKVPDMEWRIHFLLGKLRRGERNFAAAAQHYERAMAIIESVGFSIPDKELTMSFLADRYEPYRAMITLKRRELQDPVSAFLHLERFKGRHLLHELANRFPLVSTERDAFPSNSVAELNQLQKHLPRGLRILEYFISDEETTLFLVSSDSFHSFSVPVGQMKIDSLAKGLLRELRKEDTREVQSIGKELYSILVAPVESHLSSDDTLCIIPDNRLFFVPFAALTTKDDRFLVEKFKITTAPSARILMHCLRLDKGETHGTSRKVLVIAMNEDLQNARAEADTIYKRYRPHSVYLGQPDMQELGTQIKQSEIVHFVGHSSTDNQGYPGLFFAASPPPASMNSVLPRPRESILSRKHIMNWDLSHVRLVNLSACGTGLGRYLHAEGIIGLTSAFLSTGAPALLATLWEVHGRASEELMHRFYANLQKNNMRKDEALRQAKIEMMRSNGPYRSPYYWAPVVLIGDPR